MTKFLILVAVAMLVEGVQATTISFAPNDHAGKRTDSNVVSDYVATMTGIWLDLPADETVSGGSLELESSGDTEGGISVAIIRPCRFTIEDADRRSATNHIDDFIAGDYPVRPSAGFAGGRFSPVSAMISFDLVQVSGGFPAGLLTALSDGGRLHETAFAAANSSLEFEPDGRIFKRGTKHQVDKVAISVPDGGATLGLMGGAVFILIGLRRKLR